ncbi:cytochrome b5 [Ostreococcus tauri]|uniref:Cytochrome b5 n=1 Tax=Ostreococcus tauri TaxID=70448 RepID=A0A1Y5IE52_OSTTA|nr:cytochrome b5 [Ostreococcus tauri]
MDDPSRPRSAPASAGTHAKPSTTSQSVGKITLRPGYSQMDWLRRSKRERVDGGVGDVDTRRTISLEELRRHNTRNDCWIGLRGRVYNLTAYVEYHPGGAAVLEQSFGTDATALFDKYHKWVNGEYIMRATQVGVMPGFIDDDESD